MLGILKTLIKLGLFLLLFCLVTLYIPNLPPHIQFKAYSLSPIKIQIEPNYALDKAELISEGYLPGAESYAYPPNPTNNDVYASTLDGWILRVDELGSVNKITQIKNDEGRVGLTVGINFVPNSSKLIMVDAIVGLVELDVKTGDKKVLLKNGATVADQKVHLMNAVDVASDGMIYYSETSKWDLSRLLYEMIGEGSGRLIQFNRVTGEGVVLLDGLHFGNGVKLSEGDDWVLVSEFMRCRVMRYYIKGPRAGQSDIFVDGLPGYPDNIKPNNKGGFYISMYMARDEKTKILETLAELPHLRKLICRVFEMTLFISDMLSGLVSPAYSEGFTRILMNYVIPFLDISKPSSKVIIVEVDSDGIMINNYQNKLMTSLSGISELTTNGKSPWAYMGAPFSDKLWRINTKYLK